MMFGGFQFREQMVGALKPDGGGGERAFRFRLTARARSWLQYLRDHKVAIEGDVDVDGLASHARLEGELMIDPFIARVIAYKFEFTGDDRRRYVFDGKKDITPFRPVHSMTTLRGEVRGADGQVVGSAELKFPLGELPQFVGSFRPWG